MSQLPPRDSRPCVHCHAEIALWAIAYHEEGCIRRSAILAAEERAYAIRLDDGPRANAEHEPWCDGTCIHALVRCNAAIAAQLTAQERAQLSLISAGDEVPIGDYTVQRGRRSGHALADNGSSMIADLTAGASIDADTIDEADTVVSDDHDDLPAGAVADDDLDELAEELMTAYDDAIDARREVWSNLLRAGDTDRRRMIRRARLTRDELATAAARFGIVADPASLTYREGSTPGKDAADRQRSTGDVWAAVPAARAGKTTHDTRYYESSDGFEEFERTYHGARPLAAIYAVGVAAMTQAEYAAHLHDAVVRRRR